MQVTSGTTTTTSKPGSFAALVCFQICLSRVPFVKHAVPRVRQVRNQRENGRKATEPHKKKASVKTKKQLFTQEEKNFEEPPGVYKRETMTTSEGEW